MADDLIAEFNRLHAISNGAPFTREEADTARKGLALIEAFLLWRSVPLPEGPDYSDLIADLRDMSMCAALEFHPEVVLDE